jgi:hypothetical protein
MVDDADGSIHDEPDLAVDSRSPRACYSAAKECLVQQQTEEAISFLETATRVLPEYTDALSLLCGQYRRMNRLDEAVRVAMKALISPMSLGATPVSVLRWLCSVEQAPAEFADDPIWLRRCDLRFSFGGAKENQDYVILMDAIRYYCDTKQAIRAVTLMQTYGELMYRETVSFQERHGFSASEFVRWQVEVSETLLGRRLTL